MPKETAEQRKHRIREAGLRCTPARAAVLRYLCEAETPRTHSEVVEQLKDDGFDSSTLYRNLIDLAEAGLIRRQELGDHVWRFEAVRPGEDPADGHAHFVCVDCGTVRCMPEVRLDAASRNAAARIGSVTEVLVKGRCTRCPAR